MSKPMVAPYGSWKSPVSSDLVSSQNIWLGYSTFDGRGIYWIERRPSEEGRHVIVRVTPDGDILDMTPRALYRKLMTPSRGGAL